MSALIPSLILLLLVSTSCVPVKITPDADEQDTANELDDERYRANGVPTGAILPSRNKPPSTRSPQISAAGSPGSCSVDMGKLLDNVDSMRVGFKEVVGGANCDSTYPYYLPGGSLYGRPRYLCFDQVRTCDTANLWSLCTSMVSHCERKGGVIIWSRTNPVDTSYRLVARLSESKFNKAFRGEACFGMSFCN